MKRNRQEIENYLQMESISGFYCVCLELWVIKYFIVGYACIVGHEICMHAC